MAQCGGGIGRAGVRARARFDHLLLLLDSHRLPVVVSLWSSSALSGVLSCHLESLLSFWTGSVPATAQCSSFRSKSAARVVWKFKKSDVSQEIRCVMRKCEFLGGLGWISNECLCLVIKEEQATSRVEVLVSDFCTGTGAGPVSATHVSQSCFLLGLYCFPKVRLRLTLTLLGGVTIPWVNSFPCTNSRDRLSEIWVKLREILVKLWNYVLGCVNKW